MSNKPICMMSGITCVQFYHAYKTKSQLVQFIRIQNARVLLKLFYVVAFIIFSVLKVSCSDT